MPVDKFTALTPELHRYAVEHSSFRDGVVPGVEAAGEEMGDLALMQIAGDQAALMTVLVQAIGARRALEVGTFLGYGAIAIARGLPEDGELVVLRDRPGVRRPRPRSTSRTPASRTGSRSASAPALETLRELPGSEPFDFAFIDADKAGYRGYYEECLRLLRPGGLILLDNVFMGGRILDPEADDEGMIVMRELNDRLAGDERVDVAMLGIADGITVARKR